MTTPPANQIPEEPGTVILMEGERDRKPRPEALVNWPEARPPGGHLPESDEETVASAPERGQSPERTLRKSNVFLSKWPAQEIWSKTWTKNHLRKPR